MPMTRIEFLTSEGAPDSSPPIEIHDRTADELGFTAGNDSVIELEEKVYAIMEIISQGECDIVRAKVIDRPHEG